MINNIVNSGSYLFENLDKSPFRCVKFSLGVAQGVAISDKIWSVFEYYHFIEESNTRLLVKNSFKLLSGVLFGVAVNVTGVKCFVLIVIACRIALRTILKNSPILISNLTENYPINSDLGVPKDKQDALYRAVALIVNITMSEAEVKDVFSVIAKIREDQRESVCNAVSDLKRNWMTTGYLNSLIGIVSDLPEDQRESICRAAKPLIFLPVNDVSIKHILEVIRGIPEDQRKGICSLVARFTGSWMAGGQVENIIAAIARIPEDERESVCEAAYPVISLSMNGVEIGKILGAIGGVKIDQRKDVCSAAAHFIKKWGITKEIEKIYWPISTIAKDERDAILNAVARFVKDEMSGDEVGTLLWAIGGIAEDQRESVINEAPDYKIESLEIRPDNITKDLAILLWATGKIPEDQRKEVFRRAQLLLQSRFLYNGTGFILDAIAGISEDHRQCPDELEIGQVMDTLDESSLVGGFFVARCIKLIVKQGSSIYPLDRELMIKNIKEELIDEITELMGDERNGLLLRFLIEEIRSSRRILEFGENDPLENLIVMAQSQINPAFRGSDNIYAVHAALMEKKREITPPTAAHVIVAGELVNFNYQNLLQVGKVIEKPLTFAELPHIDPHIFDKLFEALEERLNKLSASEKAQVGQEINSYFGGELTLAQVKKKCTAPDRRLSYWLNYRKGENDEIAPKLMVETFKIAEILLKISNELETGDLLSPQERSLIAIGYTLTTCTTGQDEGIHAAYVLAPKENTGTSEIDELVKMESGVKGYGDYGIVMDCLWPLFQSQVAQVEMTLSFDNPFMKQCAPSSVEIIHKSLYLKNLLNEELELDHSVRLDLHGGCVDRNLREMSKGEILKYFYGYSASQLVFAVRDFLNNEFENLDDVIRDKKNRSKMLYNSVIKLLENSPGKEEAIAIDPETFKVTCSEKGALQLLEILGFFEAV